MKQPQHPLMAEALAAAKELVEADDQLRILVRAGLAPDAKQVCELARHVVRLSHRWNELHARIKAHLN